MPASLSKPIEDILENLFIISFAFCSKIMTVMKNQKRLRLINGPMGNCFIMETLRYYC